MTCHRLHTVSPNPEFLFVQGEATGEYVPLFRMTEGTPIADRYPDDPGAVRLALDPSVPGLRPGSFVGNTGGLVIVHREVAEAFEAELTLGDHEVLPLTIVDHKGRDLSRDYVFFSPLGAVDVLDADASVFRRYHDGEIAEVTRAVVSAEKLAAAPDVFRLAEDPYEVFLTGRAAALVEARGFTNVTLSDVEVR